MFDFFITHGRGFSYAVPSRNLLDQNFFLKVVCFYVIVFIIDEMDQAKANIINLLRQQAFITSNFGFDLMTRGIGKVLENYGSFLTNKSLFETGSVSYITAVVNLRLNETYLAKISLHF